LAIFSSVVVNMASQREWQPLGNRNAEDQGGEPASALSKNAPKAQQTDMVAFGAVELQPVAYVATATAILTNDFVIGAIITDGGCGYTNTPNVRIIGGGGSGAAAAAVVSNGAVVAVNVTNAGYDYTSTPLVIIDPPFFSNPVLTIAPFSFLTFSNLSLGGVYQLQQITAGYYWSSQQADFTATNSIYTEMLPGVIYNGEYRVALNPVPTQAFATAAQRARSVAPSGHTRGPVGDTGSIWPPFRRAPPR
jgi:hypothetical protein